jgi:hypothetical protein
MTYRPEIDGLRAISVLAVVLYHAGVTLLAGGFAGVDVFFVISGFLITQIIYTGARDGTFSFLHFYERRARRILPALFVMMLVTAPLLFWVLAPFQLEDYVQSVIATLVYLSNVLFWREAGYFAVEAAQKPLLHTWRLAIEEQYYLVFPLVFLAALALTFLCAWAAYRFVETPFREARTIPVPAMLATLTAAMLTLGVFGYIGHRSNGFFEAKLAMMPPEARGQVIDRKAEISERLARWAPLDARSADPFPAPSGVRRILILGDSLSEDLMMAVAITPEHAPGKAFRRLRLDDVCMGAAAHVLAAPDRAGDADPPQGCADELAGLGQVDLLAQADEVVLTAGWQAGTIDKALALAAALRDTGKAVSVVGIAAFNDMTSLSMMLGRLQQPVEAFLFANLRGRFVEVNDRLAAGVAGLEGVRFLDKLALFCDREAGRCDMLDAAGRLPIFDASHLTLGGLAMVGDRIHAQGWFRLAATASEG